MTQATPPKRIQLDYESQPSTGVFYAADGTIRRRSDGGEGEASKGTAGAALEEKGKRALTEEAGRRSKTAVSEVAVSETAARRAAEKAKRADFDELGSEQGKEMGKGPEVGEKGGKSDQGKKGVKGEKGLAPLEKKAVLLPPGKKSAGGQGGQNAVAGQAVSAGSAGEVEVGAVVATGEEGNGYQPQVSSHYALVREIARGGMGVIYEARHQDLGRTVALKIMRGAKFANSMEVGRFRAEAEAVARLDHPNIIPIYEVGEMYGQPFFTMKLADGGSLADRVGKEALPAREVARMMVKIARAVQHAHERGVLHRDLKPGNILLDAQAEPYLSDFGIAKCTGNDSGLTMPGDLVGTLGYLSPEQAHGDLNLTTACDVWALGVMLYQMLSNRMPFAGGSELQVLQRIMNEEAPPLSGLSAKAAEPAGKAGDDGRRVAAPMMLGNNGGLGAAKKLPGEMAGSAAQSPTSSRVYVDRDLVTMVARCMEKETARRMPSAGFLADELERWLAGEPIKSRHVTPAERVWKWMRRYPYRVAAMLAVLVCVLAGTVNSLVLWRQAQSANVRLNNVNDSLIHTNAELGKAVTISTAMRLASESQVQQDAGEGVLLALASVETTRKADGTLLPESVSALMNGLQRVGGTDATASRGVTEGDSDYRLMTGRSCRALPSPDGQWLITTDLVPGGWVAALFKGGLPLPEKPVRKWMLRDQSNLDIAFSNATWTPDSKQFLAVDATGELVAWDVLSGLKGAAAVEAVRTGLLAEPPPPRRLLGVVLPTDSNRYKVEFLRDAEGWPKALLYLEGVRGEFFLTRRKLELAAATPLSEPEILAEFGDGRRHVIHTSANQRWALLTEPFLKITPVLCALDDGAGPIKSVELAEPKVEIDTAAFSADGRWVAFGRADGVVRLYDLEAGDLKTVARSGRTVAGAQPQKRFALTFSPDQRWLAVSGEESIVQLIRVTEPGPPVCLRIAGRTSGANVFSPDGEWFAAGGEDRTIYVWRMNELEKAPRPILYRGLSVGLLEVSFSADNRILTGLGVAGECRRWEFNGNSAGAIPVTSAGNGNSMRALAVSPDGKWIAATGPNSGVGGEGTIRLFQVGDPLVEHALPGHDYSTGVAFSPDGRWLASTGRDAVVRVWDLPALTKALAAGQSAPAGRMLHGVATREGYNRRIAFHPAGRLYCTCGDGILFEWDLTIEDVASTVIRHSLHSIDYILTDVVVSPDGKWLVVGRHGNDGGPKPGETQHGNMVLLYDVSDPSQLVPREELWAKFRDQGRLAVSPDSRWLACGSSDAPPQVWDLHAPKISASMKLAPFSGSFVMGVTFTPPGTDGPWLALGDSTGVVNFWDWQSQPALLRRLDLADAVQGAAYLPDGRLATGSRDGRLRIWETDPNRLIELARRTVGRDLSRPEKSRLLRDDFVKRNAP